MMHIHDLLMLRIEVVPLNVPLHRQPAAYAGLRVYYLLRNRLQGRCT